MKANDLAILIAEIKNGGPSPVVADQPEPMAVVFGDETEMNAGKVVTSVFGEDALATIVVTSFRRLLMLRRDGRDLCRSYWHKINFGSWHWQEPDGYVVAGIETTYPEVIAEKTENGPPAVWQTYFISPTGERRLVEEVTVYLSQYNFHQQNRFAQWREMISPTGNPDHAQMAFVFLVYKLTLDKKSPGSVNLETLWHLYSDPIAASKQSGGTIPEESPFHPSKAKRATQKITFSKVSKGSSPMRTAKKVLRTAISTGSQVKNVVETSQKVAGLVSSVGAGVTGKGAAIASGGGSGRVATSVTLCVKCGAPLRSGTLFCGSCGYRLGETIAEEVKDQVKGKVEDAVVEKIEKVLDTEEKEKEKLQLTKKKPAASVQKKAVQKMSRTVAKCPGCGKPIEATWKFCPECSQPLPIACPNCGETLQPDWKFCPHCTVKLEGS